MDFTAQIQKYGAIISDYAVRFGYKIILALLFWFAGRFLIQTIIKAIHSKMEKQNADKTLTRYLKSVTSITLDILLIVGIMGFLGIQTTTFAALIAASGLAIGMAWSGLLANFAAGSFIMFLRPFKAGDIVSVGDIVGEVREIGLFATSINTVDNVLTLVGNNKIFSDTIKNYTANAYRRVDLTIQLSGDANTEEVIKQLKNRISSIPNVLTEPSVDIGILEFTLAGPVLAVRPYSAPQNYWQVYFDTNAAIREIVTGSNMPAMLQMQMMKTAACKN